MRIIRSICVTVAAGLVLAVLPSFASALSPGSTFLYMTGFEPQQGFTLGPIAGQGGWVGNGGEVQTATVATGTQALHLDASAVSFEFANQPLSYTINRRYVVAKTMYLRAQDNGVQAGLAVVGNTGFLAQIASFGDQYVLGNTNSSTSPQSFPTGVWHQLVMVLDFGSQTVSASIDGTPLGTIPLNPASPPTAVSFVQVYSFGNQVPNDSYADQVQVLATGVLQRR
jgi:hypothetical protein